MPPRSSMGRADSSAKQQAAKMLPHTSNVDSTADADDNAEDDNVDAKPATKNANEASTVTDKELEAMQGILKHMYEFRTAEGEDPSKLFHRKVNRRFLPDYYNVIKEPMAMSTIKAKLNTREYQSFEEFVRDWALICHNAQLYNSPKALAYVNAMVIKVVVQEELYKLAEKGVVEKSRVTLPFMGEIPPAEEVLAQDEEEDDDDDDEEEDEEEDSEDDGKKKQRKRGRPSLGAKRERESKIVEGKEKDDDPDLRKKRGRPPRVDTPLEARIKAVLKGLRKPRNSEGELLVLNFERVPDKAEVPDYFTEIKNPIAMDGIKRKLKRKKYTSVDQFMRDVDLMFNNAKQYNTDESDVYRYANELQREAHSLAEQEKNKPDTEFTMEDGRMPLPQGILHNGEVWRVGDWVHIQNQNDITKPIIAQIYRTWQDPDGSKWVNACWYYRPEQTVHRFDRHFWDGEVMKTGQYRDHPIDEVVDRCFVMFFTRFSKGRPRGFPKDKEVYVCECRYNEEKHKLNKIKTWASCLPDEVRDKDYEMDLFDHPRKLKKFLSPISYLLPKDAKETDEIPKPKWGAPNAPPTIGAVHNRPRDPKDSPPPEPTPTPPPQPAPQPVRQMSHQQPNGYGSDRSSQINIASANTPRHPGHVAPISQAMHTPGGSYAPGANSHNPQYNPSPSPAPIPQSHHNNYSSQTQPLFSHHQSQQPHTYNSSSQASSGTRQTQLGPAPVAYKAPNPVEVWHLPDTANASIPAAIRDQFQQDEQGRVLFFTAPPASSTSSKKKLQHSASYLAFRARKLHEKVESNKRLADSEATVHDADLGRHNKKARNLDSQDIQQGIAFQTMQNQALENINKILVDSTVAHLHSLHGDLGLQKAVDAHMHVLTSVWENNARQQETTRQSEAYEFLEGKTRPQAESMTPFFIYKPPNEHLEWRSRG